MQYDTLKRTKKTSGTSYKGIIKTSYDALVRVFGNPHRHGLSDGKTQAEWAFELGTMIITIYDYKEKVEAEKVIEWNIGSKSSAEQVLGFVNGELKRAGESSEITQIN